MEWDTMKRDEEIKNLFLNKKLTMQEIGEMYDISRQRVHQILSKHDIKGQERRMNQEKIKRNLALEKEVLRLANGKIPYSSYKISKILKVSPRKVKSIFDKHGIYFDNRWAYIESRNRYNEILDFAIKNPDMPYNKIAEKFSVSVATVVRALRRNGYYRRGNANAAT